MKGYRVKHGLAGAEAMAASGGWEFDAFYLELKLNAYDINYRWFPCSDAPEEMLVDAYIKEQGWYLHEVSLVVWCGRQRYFEPAFVYLRNVGDKEGWIPEEEFKKVAL